jgi:hypothetical protein
MQYHDAQWSPVALETNRPITVRLHLARAHEVPEDESSHCSDPVAEAVCCSHTEPTIAPGNSIPELQAMLQPWKKPTQGCFSTTG